ncbi:MAG TPA: DUF4118 domain-containing protein [Streptosporangiaceae bacterium]
MKPSLATRERRRRGLSAPLALPAGFGALLAVGAAAAGTHGGLDALWVLILASAIVLAGCAVAEPVAAPVLGAIGWLTVIGFSAAPYAQLRPAWPQAWRAAAILLGCAVTGLICGAVVRRAASSVTLFVVEQPDGLPPAGAPGSEQVAGPLTPGLPMPLQAAARPGQQASSGSPGPAARPSRRRRWPVPDLAVAVGGRRLLAGVLLVAGLPLLTVALTTARGDLSLADDLLIYLVAVVAVAVVGGFWPALLAAVTASLLLNWYFTEPVHTLTIADPQNLLALMLFVTVAVTVSSVVHLAALRARQAARNSDEAAQLLSLAQTVLGGADTPADVLDHLTSTLGGAAQLLELAGGQWVRVAASGWPQAGRDRPQPDGPVTRIHARGDVVLEVTGQRQAGTGRLMAGYAAQVAAALDRDRLRTQAAQSEALAEGNRMRTALLAAVSHDLRTPLASIKASVSTLRQTDVAWDPDDEAALLATIEQSADRLDALIGNLLDMSRLTTRSLRPFLRPTAIDEVAPVALRGLDADGQVALQVPDGLPLVSTDPGLLERVLANLLANALAYSPPGRPPVLRARAEDDSVLLEIVDHGRGVPDELKESIFEPFRRLDAREPGAAVGTAPAGVGLGLAVVKGFLETMGGQVTAADTPGGGLTMLVTLPAGVASASVAAER